LLVFIILGGVTPTFEEVGMAQHGGSRPNTGRKKGSGKRGAKLSVGIAPKCLEAIRAVAQERGASIPAIVEAALEQAGVWRRDADTA
jgi:hypothetical protein